MPKSFYQKLKILYILKILWEYTDEEHGLTLAEISEKLALYGIEAERKSLYDDFEMLNHFGLEVVKSNDGHRVLYSLITRNFSVGELKLLVDAVQSSRFLTRKRSEELTEKLTTLLSVYDARALERQVQVTGRVKMMNENIFISIDRIHSAISQNHPIAFDYMEWNDKRELTIRADGSKKHISPLALVWDNEFYYLVAYDPAKEDLRHYRVDKMQRVEIEDGGREGFNLFEDSEIETYVEQRFSMFAGERQAVTVSCTRAFLGPFIERFGDDLHIRKNKDRYLLHFHVAVTDVFFGWIAGLSDDVRIVSPQSVVDAMAVFADKLYRRHENKRVKAVILDLGMVLVDFRYRAFMDDIGFDRETADFFSDNIILAELWKGLDRGKYTQEECVDLLQKKYPQYRSEIAYFFERIEGIVEEYPDSEKLVKDLKNMGYEVYILTNYPDHMYRIHSPKWKFLPYTDGAVVSSFEKMSKPSEAFYRCLLNRYGLTPSECVFLDDNKNNVDAAASIGIHSIVVNHREEAFRSLFEYLRACGKQ